MIKKALLILFLSLALSHYALSQNIHLGVIAGANQSYFYLPEQLYDTTPSSITGFHAGIFGELDLGRIAIEPQILYASIGGNNFVIDAHSSSSGPDKLNLHYLQFPVNVLYKIPVPFGKVFIGGGPYVGVGLSGTENVKFTYAEENIIYTGSFSRKYQFSGADNPDYGLNALAGIQFKNRLLLSLGYGYGLKYVYYKADDGAIKNEVISVSIGYVIF